ncbi:MAG: RodZ domain-containing protein [Acidobacteriota bacterium]
MRKTKRRTSSDDAAAAVADPASDAESFGPWLRRQREGRGIDLREIADESKISLRYLEALESNRFEALPAPVFTKGFLRQYASYVGLDAEEVLNYYLAAETAIEEKSREDLPEELRIDSQQGRSPKMWRLIAGLIVLALLLAAGYWWLNADRASGAQGPAQNPGSPADPGATRSPASGPAAPGSEAADPGTADAEFARSGAAASPAEPAPDASDSAPFSGGSAAAAAGDGPAAAARAPVHVVVDFTGDCWVEATIDGEARIAEMRVQGESLVLEGTSSVDLKVGNIDVVRLEVNGRPWPASSGGGSTVRQLRFDLETLAAAEAAPQGGG